MLISSNSVGLPASQALENAASGPVTPVKMELLRSLLIVERLAEIVDTAAVDTTAVDTAAVDTAAVDTASADPLDQALDTFWQGMVDDGVHRTGAELARHNYQRNLDHIAQKGSELMRAVDAMPSGPQRHQAQQKLTQFLADQRTQIEGQHQLDRSDQAVPISTRLLRSPAVIVRSQPPADPASP